MAGRKKKRAAPKLTPEQRAAKKAEREAAKEAKMEANRLKFEAKEFKREQAEAKRKAEWAAKEAKNAVAYARFHDRMIKAGIPAAEARKWNVKGWMEQGMVEAHLKGKFLPYDDPRDPVIVVQTVEGKKVESSLMRPSMVWYTSRMDEYPEYRKRMFAGAKKAAAGTKNTYRSPFGTYRFLPLPPKDAKVEATMKRWCKNEAARWLDTLGY